MTLFSSGHTYVAILNNSSNGRHCHSSLNGQLAIYTCPYVQKKNLYISKRLAICTVLQSAHIATVTGIGRQTGGNDMKTPLQLHSAFFVSFTMTQKQCSTVLVLVRRKRGKDAKLVFVADASGQSCTGAALSCYHSAPYCSSLFLVLCPLAT